MSTQGAVIAGVVALGMACVGALSIRSVNQPITAGIWFEDVSAGGSDAVTARLGAAVTRPELKRIEAVARAELTAAFSYTRVTFSDSPRAMYRLRVVQHLGGGPRAALPVAGLSRPLPGRRGVGAINFRLIASSAIAYAPAGTPRDDLIAAIGRGIGRTAVHEFAHQMLGSFPLHQTADPLSYEYADLRPEHFYGELHWAMAAPALAELIGQR
jgi:hypothetical protein